MTSRNLLNLVDNALSATATGPGSPTDFRAALDEAQTIWVAAARRHQAELEAVAERVLVEQRVEELKRQVAAFDNEESRVRRERNDQRLAEAAWLESLDPATSADLAALVADVARRLGTSEWIPPGQPGGADPDVAELASALRTLREALRDDLAAQLAAKTQELDAWRDRRETSEWQERVHAAAVDTRTYTQELAALGLDPAAYAQVRTQLAEQQSVLADLDARAAQLPKLQAEAGTAWAAMETLSATRRTGRTNLLVGVAERSEILRFSLRAAGDDTAWTQRIRELLNLRSDGFLEEVSALARWLWTERAEEQRESRLEMWRTACVSGDFVSLAASARLRPAWAARLQNLDPLVRARLAAEIPEDTVSMRFLREGGDATRDQDWQPLTAGSPGQRSAAMLSFVLHYGTEPLVLDQPEDDLDTEWITQLVVRQLRTSRWTRQLIVVTHNANIPVNADAERTIVLENAGRGITIRTSPPTGVASEPHEHCGPLEDHRVRADIQQIMEGGIDAFVRRERRYNNELNTYRAALQQTQGAGRQGRDSTSPVPEPDT
jgi:hypothetical protein